MGPLRSSFASAAMSMPMIALSMMSACVLYAAASTIDYSTGNGASVAPQGNFYDASGKRLSLTSSTSSTLEFNGVVTRIGNYAFHNCCELTSITLPNSVTSVGYFAFSNCKTLNSPVYNATLFARLPENYSTSYAIPEGIKIIASAALRNCSNLPAVTIPNGVTSIEESAFAYCSSLETITIPASVTSIDEFAFQNCTGLTSIYAGTIPAQIDATTFNNIDKTKCVLYVPNGSKVAYENSSYWNEFSTINEYTPNSNGLENVLNYDEEIILTDGIEYTRTTATYTSLFSYSRKFSVTTWCTIVLPVALDYDDWSANFEMAEISGVDVTLNADGSIKSFTPQQTILGQGSQTVPNRPYMIRAKKANSKTAQIISKTNCIVYPAEAQTVEHTYGNYIFRFIGTYCKVAAPNLTKKYTVGGGVWKVCSSTSSVGAFRIYLEIEKSNSPQDENSSNSEDITSDDASEYTAVVKLTDSESYTSTSEVKASLFSYSRKFSVTTWCTIVLPVALDYDDWSANFEMAEISGVDVTLNADGSIKSFTPQQTILGQGSQTVPNRPYLIRAKKANSKTAQIISKTNCIVYPAEAQTVEYTYGNYTFRFIGTYCKVAAPNLTNKYTVGGGVWKACSSTSSVGAFRIYLEIVEEAASNSNLLGSGQEEDNNDEEIYDVIMKFTDGDTYTGTEKVNAALFSYSRIFKVTTWGTIVLPVALDYEDWSSSFEFAEITGVDVSLNSDGTISSFDTQRKVLGAGSQTEPNRPYFIRAKKANSTTAQTIRKKNCTVYPAEAQVEEFTYGNYTFRVVGTYDKMEAGSLIGKYCVGSGKWIACKATSTMMPMRNYLEIIEDASAASKAPNRETALEDVRGDIVPDVTTVSSRIIGLKPGTYNINGRKIIVTY